MENIKITLENEKQKFDMEVDGVNRPFWLWTKGLDEGTFYFDKEEDKKWYKSLGWNDRDQVSEEIKNIIKEK